MFTCFKNIILCFILLDKTIQESYKQVTQFCPSDSLGVKSSKIIDFSDKYKQFGESCSTLGQLSIALLRLKLGKFRRTRAIALLKYE